MPEGTFNLNENQGNQALNPANPLNSGNGQAQSSAVNPTTPGADQPHQITPEELQKSQTNDTPPVVTAPQGTSSPAPTQTPPPEQPKGEGNAKKYIIIAIVAIALLTGAYFGYSFFMNDSGESEENDTETTEESSKTNKLGDDSNKTEEEDSEKLEELTEELEKTFGDETTGDEDAPPSLSIGGSSENDETKEPETSGTPKVSDETVATEASDTGDTTKGSETNEGGTTSDTTETTETSEPSDDEKIVR